MRLTYTNTELGSSTPAHRYYGTNTQTDACTNTVTTQARSRNGDGQTKAGRQLARQINKQKGGKKGGHGYYLKFEQDCDGAIVCLLGHLSLSFPSLPPPPLSLTHTHTHTHTRARTNNRNSHHISHSPKSAHLTHTHIHARARAHTHTHKHTHRERARDREERDLCKH